MSSNIAEITTNSTAELLNRGMTILVRQMGVIDAEKFISIVNREKFDYTKWQRTLFDDMTFDEMHEAAVAYAKENPFKMNKKWDRDE